MAYSGSPAGAEDLLDGGGPAPAARRPARRGWSGSTASRVSGCGAASSPWTRKAISTSTSGSSSVSSSMDQLR